MFSLPLFKQSIKSNGVFLLVNTAILILLNVEFSMIEPTKPMLFVIFYGMMTLIVPSIYVLVTSNSLISNQVDRGSMAYILSNPVKRSAVVFTQASYFVLSLAGMFLVNTFAALGANSQSEYNLSMAQQAAHGATGYLTTEMIIQLNFSCFAVTLALAGITFMFSSIFNLSKYAMAFSGTVIGVSILAKIMSLFGTMGIKEMSNFKYLTFGSLFDVSSILQGKNDWVVLTIVALLISFVGFVIGSVWFAKKDLPL